MDRRICRGIALLCVACTGSLIARAQAPDAGNAGASVPRLINFSGVVRGASGKALSGNVGVTFSLYSLPDGGSPLWVESQTVQLDEQGHYTAVLGAASPPGLPLDLFTSGKALWLGVQPQLSGGGEQPRVLLVAVPYALKAADAETLGGKPASDFVTFESQATTAASLSAAAQAGAVLTAGSTASATRFASAKSLSTIAVAGTMNTVPKFGATADIIDSDLFDSSGKVGINTTTPKSALDIRGGLAVGSYAGTTAAPANGLIVSGLVGFGRSVPTSPLDVLMSSSSSSSTYSGKFENDTTFTAPVSEMAALTAIVHPAGRASINLDSSRGAEAVNASVFNYNTAAVTNLIGFRLDQRNLSTGAVTNAVGAYIPYMSNTGGGTIANTFGMKIDDQSAGTSNYGYYSGLNIHPNTWGFYAAGTAPNYFAGGVGIGTSHPSAMLEVNGTVKFDQLVTFAAAQTFPAASGTLLGTLMLASDLGGTAVAPRVVRLQGRPISNLTPASNQVLMWNGSAWAPGTVSSGISSATSTGSGTSGSLAKWTGTTTLGSSPLTDASGSLTSSEPVVAPSFNTNGSGAGVVQLSAGTASVSWTLGTGAPAGTCTVGSLFSRTDGGAGSTLYVCQGPTGSWTAK